MDEITTVNEIDAVSQDTILGLVQLYLQQDMVIAPTLLDFTALVGPGEKSVSYPRFGGFTPEKKLAATKFTAQSITGAADKLDLDEHYGVRYIVEDIAELQSKPGLMQLFAERAARDLAFQMDQHIYNEIKQVSASSPDHKVAFASGSALSKADFTEAKRLLRKQNAPMDNPNDLFLLVSPDYEKQILDLSDFVDSDRWQSGSEQIKFNGQLGRAYGFNIIVSNAVGTGLPLFYHRTHGVFARQMMPRLSIVANNDYGAKDVLIHHNYGDKVLDLGKRGVQVGSAS